MMMKIHTPKKDRLIKAFDKEHAKCKAAPGSDLTKLEAINKKAHKVTDKMIKWNNRAIATCDKHIDANNIKINIFHMKENGSIE
jgi:hypothetical protein